MKCACEISLDVELSSGFSKNKIVKARKVHKCHECRTDIQPGDQYETSSGVYGGYFYHHKTCLDCLSLRIKVFINGWWYGQIWEDFFENVGCDISEDCIASLTRKAREKVCAHIEECWLVEEAEE